MAKLNHVRKDIVEEIEYCKTMVSLVLYIDYIYLNPGIAALRSSKTTPSKHACIYWNQAANSDRFTACGT